MKMNNGLVETWNFLKFDYLLIDEQRPIMDNLETVRICTACADYGLLNPTHIYHIFDLNRRVTCVYKC